VIAEPTIVASVLMPEPAKAHEQASSAPVADDIKPAESPAKDHFSLSLSARGSARGSLSSRGVEVKLDEHQLPILHSWLHLLEGFRYSKRYVLVLEFTIYHSSSSFQMEGEELVGESDIEIVSMTSIATIASEAGPSSEFVISGVDEETGKAFKLQFRCESVGDRDRWIVGLNQHMRKLKELMAAAATAESTALEALPSSSPSSSSSSSSSAEVSVIAEPTIVASVLMPEPAKVRGFLPDYDMRTLGAHCLNCVLFSKSGSQELYTVSLSARGSARGPSSARGVLQAASSSSASASASTSTLAALETTKEEEDEVDTALLFSAIGLLFKHLVVISFLSQLPVVADWLLLLQNSKYEKRF
jgi:hypothetical protein